MIFTFGNYVLDIDVEKTREIYEKLRTVSEKCGCNNCLNFEKATEHLPRHVRALFDKLGVDVKKITECYINTQNNDGSVFYAGFCHLSGRLIQGGNAWIQISEDRLCFDEKPSAPVGEAFHMWFQEKCYMVETEFGSTIIEMEFYVNLPWLLDVAYQPPVVYPKEN